MIDNRTNEQAIAEADALYDSIGVTVFRVEFRELYTDLRTPGCLTGEPSQNETKLGQEFCFTEAQVEAAAKAIADCHNPGMFEKYPENWKVEARAALVAATRVPVQGEPNDDREVLDNVLIDAREAGDGLSAVRNRILAAGFSRATVPDAATTAIAEVRALHRREPGTGVDWCSHCIDNDGPWPCSTIAALDWAPEPEVKP